MLGTDARGTLHRRCDDRTKLRIVSLVPPLTELLCDLGLAPVIVGRTGYCIHPAAEVDLIPTLGSPRNVDIDRVHALAPTHIVVDLDTNDAHAIQQLEKLVPHVIATRVRAPRDNLGLFRLFGYMFAGEREADRLAKRFESAWSGLAQRLGPRPDERVLVLTAKDPWTTVARDTYVAAMLAMIGWSQIDVTDAIDADASTSRSRPAIDLDRVGAVDRILLAGEAHPFGEEHVAALARRAPRVEVVDGERLAWFGPRAIAGLDYLAALAADR